MKRLLLFLAVVISFHTVDVRAIDVMRMGVLHIPPYIEINQNDSEVTGLVPILMKEIMTPLDIEVRFVTLAVPRLRRDLNSGEIDAFPLMLDTGNTSKTVRYSEVYLTSTNYVYAIESKHRQGLQWQILDDLSTHLIGVIKGASYGSDADTFIQKYPGTIYYSEEIDQQLKLLVSGRLDGVFINEDIVTTYAANHKNVNFVKSDKAIYSNFYALGISNKSPLVRRIDDINAQIIKLKQQGVLKRMKQQYLAGK